MKMERLGEDKSLQPLSLFGPNGDMIMPPEKVMSRPPQRVGHYHASPKHFRQTTQITSEAIGDITAGGRGGRPEVKGGFIILPE
jgi:hypothetical protein